MVNLLFISSNSKIDFIKTALQPFLKAKIDTVSDFDFGLKEVFEKRPAMVFFQDQIAGVMGESVARHIQLLLGSDSPSFIYMHNGDPKAKPVKGLYDYLVDLSQDDTKVVADIQSTLKLLLGPKWQQIYDPYKANKSVDMTTLTVPAEHRVIADKLMDNCISDSGNITDSSTNNRLFPDVALPGLSSEEPVMVVSSTNDQLEEIIASATSGLIDKKIVTATASDPGKMKVSVTPETVPSSVNLAPAATSQQVPASVAHDSAAVSGKSSAAQAASRENESSVTAHISVGMAQKSPSTPISPADFRIKRERLAEEAATEESLRAFEANYLSGKASRKRYQTVAVVLVLCLIGVSWYLFKVKPHLMQSVVKKSTQASVPATAIQPLTPVPVVQQSVSSTQRPVTVVLPSFIPLAGHDRAFATQKPGWERYIGPDSEFRVYRPAGKLKAVQVLATEGHVISESRLKTILIELTGTGEYGITSHEQKFGFQVSRATVNRKADLLIYRNESGVHAFIVSLD